MQLTLLTVTAFFCVSLLWHHAALAEAPAKPASKAPLPFRIVSFHQGQANKDLIRRAAEVGFNGVEFQLEKGNLVPTAAFAKRDAQEGYIKLCHQLGMKVTLWMHEFSDIPKDIGPISVDNQGLWDLISQRYDNLFSKQLPDIDGIVLTTVETQINATDPDVAAKLVAVIHAQCVKYKKEMMFRTFVHYTEQLKEMQAVLDRIPEDVIVVSKCVSQDWHLRSVHESTIGHVGARRQLVEWDVAGEFFLLNHVANCFPDLLKTQLDYGMSQGINGICVRVDRWDIDILDHPNEVNMWTLGLLASGKATTVDECWHAWATARYGEKAAPAVIKALKTSTQVVQEALYAERFIFFHPRRKFWRGNEDPYSTKGEVWRWDESYLPDYNAALAGDLAFVERVDQSKTTAYALAQAAMKDIDAAKELLAPEDYEILRQKLFNNLIILQTRGRMIQTFEHYRAYAAATEDAPRTKEAAIMRELLKQIDQLATATYPAARQLTWKDKTWQLGPPDGAELEKVQAWVRDMNAMIETK